MSSTVSGVDLRAAGTFNILENTAPSPGNGVVAKAKKASLLTAGSRRHGIAGATGNERRGSRNRPVSLDSEASGAVTVPEPTGLALASGLGLVLLAIVQRLRSTRIRSRDAAGIGVRF